MSVSYAPNSSLLNPKTNKTDNERKRKNNTTMESASKHLKSNYYSPLDIEDDFQCDEGSLKKFEEHVQEHNKISQKPINVPLSGEIKNSAIGVSTPHSTNVNNQQCTSQYMNSNNQNKKEKIPPIHIFDIDSSELINFIKDCLKINDFKIKEFKNANRKKISLFLTTIECYVRVKVHLEKAKTKFFTFTPKCAKTKTFLLKGLPADIKPEEIIFELRKHENEHLKFIKVSQFATPKSRKEGYELPIFLVQITSESNIKSLKSIRGLLYRCVKWEPLKKEEIPQCRKCQGFFHSASNCFMEQKCVKCDKSHDVGKCSLSKVEANDRDKLYCVLCNKYGHPASYRGCEKYKDLQKKIKSKRQEMTQNRGEKYMNVNSNLSFANALKINNNNLDNSNNLLNNNFFTELQNSIQNLSNQILNFQKQLQMQTSRIDTLYSMFNEY